MKKQAKPKANKKLSELLQLNEVREIATGITSEKLNAMFFDATKLKYQPEPLYRLDSKGHRYYYLFDKDGEPQFYTSVTTMIRDTLPTSPHLIQWLVDKRGEGKDEAEERANYGTFLHQEFASLLVNGKYNLDDLSQKLQQFATSKGIQTKDDWVGELKKDLLALSQFVIDKRLEPLAIEICLWHPQDGYAGAIDIVCMADIEDKGFWGETYASGIQKGQPKESKRINRERIIVDLKSGRKSFYESHQIQLKAYQEMWNIHFPDLLVKRFFNVSPKEWKSTPSYNFTEQTDSKCIAKLPHLVELSKIEDSRRENTITTIQGIVDLLKGVELNITEKTFTELVKSAK
jgi:hypothetical protein